ncbi:MAG: GNAT family N-acetyltransferase [Deltaproteobacteria bacterium]|nr:GNAT family N-acetyltransferase [Deltaproteobacteria bacterium]
MILEVVPLGTDVVDAALERELVALVARALPHAHLNGRWYWDSRPDVVVVAREGASVIGFRMILWRDVVVGARSCSIVGTGVAVDPDWQRQGIATALTHKLLELATGRDAIVVFLGTDEARPLLDRFGFQLLGVPVSSKNEAGAVVVEEAPCLVKELKPGFTDGVEAAGSLFLGRGTW